MKKIFDKIITLKIRIISIVILEFTKRKISSIKNSRINPPNGFKVLEILIREFSKFVAEKNQRSANIVENASTIYSIRRFITTI